MTKVPLSDRQESLVSRTRALLHETHHALSVLTAAVEFHQKRFASDLEDFFKQISPALTDDQRKKSAMLSEVLKRDLLAMSDSLNALVIINKFVAGTLIEDENSSVQFKFGPVLERAKEVSGVSPSEMQSKMPQNFSLQGNPILFERVLVNLMNNALEAMKDRKDKVMFLDCDYKDIKNKRVAHFIFSDNGPGIPQQIFKKIFDPGKSTQTGDRGHGLYICKQIIEDFHHGQIIAKNKPEGVQSLLSGFQPEPVLPTFCLNFFHLPSSLYKI